MTLTFGQTLLCGGIGLAAVGALGLVIGNAVLAAKAKKVKKQLYDRYGF